MRQLPLFINVAGQDVILVGDGDIADAKRRLVERAGGIVVGEESSTARIAFVILDEPEEAAVRLKARGILVNVADRAELCDFTLPAIVDRSPVLVAVGTAGTSAGLAKMLRLAIERLLPERLGELSQKLWDLRPQIRAKFPTMDERRRVLDLALDEGGTLDPFDTASPDRVNDWLAGAADTAGPRRVTITLRSDLPDDLTLAEARLLGRADMIWHAPDCPPAILGRARADAARRTGEPEGEPQGLEIVIRNG